MLGIYASISPVVVHLMVSLLLALGWLVTQLIKEEDPAAQKVSAHPATERQHMRQQLCLSQLRFSSR
ncbi:hypothetical protein [Pseudomonas luteola]|uniref:Uncharacterized protein n=2 Tax=Pseudomonas luteola TaxID=47886 RepID=A0ABS0FU49_PSELU|nr:hypothetical protein [Pseudomonas zeshuii]MBF8643855.1 hypothetical protein [Pseudomonas zeshuii]